MTSWTRITDPDTAVAFLPAWFAGKMLGVRGSYGFLLATGDVVRVSRVTAVHVSNEDTILVDVLLDHAGVPDGVDLAWESKHFLGAPVPGANLATLNLAQIVMAVEFVVVEIAETANDDALPASDMVPFDAPERAAEAVLSEGERVA